MAEEPNDKKTGGAMFGTSFRGYDRAEVDSHFAHLEKESQHLLSQIGELRKGLEEAKLAEAQAGARVAEAESRREGAEASLKQMVAEVERLKADLDLVKAERDAALARTANLDSEENAAREVLKAAHKTAEEMREQGRIEAQARMLAAEEHAQHVEAEARRKVRELEEKEAEMRARYDKFLSEARALSSGFVREIDEARDGT